MTQLYYSLIEWKRICSGVFISFVYTCIAVGDLVIKGGGGPINRFNSATLVFLSQAMACISYVMCRVFILFNE
jgi:hypothetical protein